MSIESIGSPPDGQLTHAQRRAARLLAAEALRTGRCGGAQRWDEEVQDLLAQAGRRNEDAP